MLRLGELAIPKALRLWFKPAHMRKLELNGRWVVVTGASSGLGREMARDLAKRHRANLVLVARRHERLEELKTELQLSHGVQIQVIAADLSKVEDVDRAFAAAVAEHEVQAFVLNAGVTHFGPHAELSWQDFEAMLDTNVRCSVRFAHHVVPYLLHKDHGGALMFVTSMSGLQPVPYQTAYSGTKAFLTTFAVGLYHELAGKNLSITTFAPGGIETEMTQGNGLVAHFGSGPQIQPADWVARQAVNALVKRSYLAVPGTFNRLQVWLPRFLPRRLVGNVVAAAYVKALAARPHETLSEGSQPSASADHKPQAGGSGNDNPQPNGSV